MNWYVYANYRVMLGILRFMIKHNIMRKYAIYALLYSKEE